MKLVHFILTTVLFLFLSCSSNDAQEEFEREAFRSPSGYTEVNAQGQIINTDPDDWRISPLYQGLIHVNPPFPNPASIGSPINFEINVIGIQSVPGLDVQVRYDNGTFNNLYTSFINPLPAGVTTFQIDPIQLGQFNNAESARGLHRVFLFDLNQRLISYGDIQVE